ncbi:MAG: hypothetical protein QOJ98_686 [Acidobacteriota bacterium]|jgi:hypothetical protein|nr:hypothetical protein [Acidobacteriota bacterium]
MNFELRVYELETEQRWNFLQWFGRGATWGVVARFISFRDDHTFVSLHEAGSAVPDAPGMVKRVTVRRLAALAAVPFDARRVAESPVIELRFYRIAPGMGARFRQFFNERTVAAQERSGMSVCGQFDDLDDENLFVWLRGFPDLAERDRRKADFYQSAYWLEELQDEAFAMIEDYSNVVLVTPV